MVNLYWKNKDQIKDVEQKPFINESEFEKYIYSNQSILGGDIYIIHRQIRTGAKEGIPDMLGVDQDSRICMIEIKNEEAVESILPQALQYAIWAETNPDSIKALWLESKEKPEGITIDWDNIDIRIILIAPSFKQNVLKMSKKIGYPVQLFQIKRYSIDEDEFISVEVLEEEEKKIISTKATEDWSWDYYEKEHGKDSTTQFKCLVELIDSYVKKQKWILPYNINKYYTGFKSGNRVIFSVGWGSTYLWHIKFKISEKIAKEYKGQNWEFQRYDNSFNEAIFKYKGSSELSIDELDKLFKLAYEGSSGKSKT